jgi:hemoglobin-like flavoprotein
MVGEGSREEHARLERAKDRILAREEQKESQVQAMAMAVMNSSKSIDDFKEVMKYLEKKS